MPIAKYSPVAYFEHAAAHYDEAASVQAEIAKRLAHKIAHERRAKPRTILDLGCGTGNVSEALARLYPDAQITALDAAPTMLKEAKRKTPNLFTIIANMEHAQFAREFDLIVSSMALHWLADPRAELERWQGWLKPGGQIFAALLAENSFREWREHCAGENIVDGLWAMPDEDFASGLKTERETISISYPSALDFLRKLKTTGAAMPRHGHRPLSSAMMRRLLVKASKPFTVSYDVLYVATTPSQGKS